MITLIVTMLGSSTIAVIVATTYNYASVTAEGSSIVSHFILQNLPYLDLSLHPLVYGLYYVIVKPHHEEDIFVIIRGRGVNNKDILRVQVGFNWLLSQHGFYTTCLQ